MSTTVQSLGLHAEAVDDGGLVALDVAVPLPRLALVAHRALADPFRLADSQID